MSRFTPGPWQIWEGPLYVGGGADLCIGAGEEWLANMDHPMCRMKYVRGQEVCEIDENHISICSIDTEITDIQRANAKLIAAAPDLLAALRVAAEHPCAECGVGASSDSHSPSCIIGRAIQRATGEEMIDERLPGGKFYIGD